MRRLFSSSATVGTSVEIPQACLPLLQPAASARRGQSPLLRGPRRGESEREDARRQREEHREPERAPGGEDGHGSEVRVAEESTVHLSNLLTSILTVI